MHLRAQSSFLELLRYKEKKPWNPPTPEEMARVRQETLELKERMLEEFPGLRVEPRPVPDERNGFLALHLLRGSSYQAPVVESGLARMIEGSAPWDSAAVKAGLEAHADVVAEYERIAAMEERSSANMPPDYSGFISARVAKRGADLLLAKARLAAEEGDEEETLRLVAAAQNLASHFREVEAASLLAETVVILIDLSVQSTAFEHLLPALGDGSDPARWKSVIFQRGYDSMNFAEMLRGEWHTTTEFMLFPILMNPGNPDSPPDLEELARAYSSVFHDVVSGLPGLDLRELLDAPAAFELAPGRFPELSGKSRELLEVLGVGSSAWAKGYVRAASTIARNEAALDLLIRERKGSAGEPGIDPFSGQPLVFDPDERTLSVPAATAELEIKPLKLPW